MNKLKILIGRDGTFEDLSNVYKKVTWSGRKGAAARSCDITFFDSETYKDARPSVNCEKGQTCILYENNKEIFQGLVMEERRSSESRELSVKVYDQGIRLCNNKDSFTYKKKRADQIVSDCLKRLGLKAGSLANTGHVIGELVKKGTTYWDVIQDALSQTYRATGKRYYLFFEKGKGYLKRRTEAKSMTILELKTNIKSYEATRSIYNTRTGIKLTTSKGVTKGQYINSSLESKIGKFQEVESVDEDITATEVKQRIQVFKEEKGLVSKSLKITGFGETSVISGSCVYVIISNVGLKRVMYVDEDSHTWENGGHTMSLTLNYAKDIDRAG